MKYIIHTDDEETTKHIEVDLKQFRAIKEDEKKEVVNIALGFLKFHFDTAAILVTSYNEITGTDEIKASAGNAYAIRGQITEWLQEQREANRKSKE